MGQIVQMAWTGLAAVNQARINNAMNDAKKNIGMAQVDATNLLNETNAAAANAIRGENNTLLAAKAALSNMQRSIGNESKLREAGSRVNAATTNLLRIRDKNTQGTLERRIRNAEQQGAMTAQMAASGTGGATARMLHLALQGTAARQETQIEGQQAQQSFDMLMQRNGILPGVIMALDQGQTFAPIDHTVSVAQPVITPMWEADYDLSPFVQGGQAIGGMMAGVAGSIWGQQQSYSPDSSGTSFGQSNWYGGFGSDGGKMGGSYSYTTGEYKEGGGYSYFGSGSSNGGFGAGNTGSNLQGIFKSGD